MPGVPKSMKIATKLTAAMAVFAAINIVAMGAVSVVSVVETQSSVARDSDAEHLAQVNRTRNLLAMVGLAEFAIALMLAAVIARRLGKPLTGLNEAAGRIAAREYDVDIPAARRGDELGGIARALDTIRQHLADADRGARDAAFRTAAFEITGAPMLLTDLHLKVVGANTAFFRLVNENRKDFNLGARNLTLDAVLGADLSTFSFPPAEIRAAVVDHARLPIKKKLSVGDSYIGLLIDLVKGGDGTPVGYVFDMKNQTFQMLGETILKAINSQQIRVELGLDGTIHEVNDRCREALSMSESDVHRSDGQAFHPSCDERR